MESNVGIGECLFCGKDNLVVVATSMTPCYCEDCFKLTLHEIREAIKDIQKFKKENKISRKAEQLKHALEYDVAEPCTAEERWEDRKCQKYCDVAKYCNHGKQFVE